MISEDETASIAMEVSQDTYVRMTNAWLDDVDGHKNKVWWYFVK